MFNFDVNLYDKPLDDEEKLLDVVYMVHERLHLYKLLEKIDLMKTVDFFPLFGMGTIKRRRIDYISHWFMRIACCKNSYLRQVFLANEYKWFKMRFKNMILDQHLAFLHANKISPIVTTVEEKTKLKLIAPEMEEENFYFKSSFTEMLTLMKTRRFLLYKGFLYFPRNKVLYWVLERFQQDLKKQLEYIQKVLPTSEYEQVNTILYMVEPSLSSTFLFTGLRLTLEDLDSAVAHFPLCVRSLHHALKTKNHLKFNGRMQYIRFLKGIGLTIEDMIALMQREFTKKMTLSQFTKNYVYYIKHIYGLVGSRIDYKPMKCMKILDTTPGPNEVHGCPFMYEDEETLTNELKAIDVPPNQIVDILEMKQAEKYQAACGTCYGAVHGCTYNGLVKSPTDYYVSSLEITDIEDLFSEEE